MARVREFQCDMCSVHEKTTEASKPKTWVQLKTKSPGRLVGSIRETVIVCSDCAEAINKAATDLVRLVQVTIASRKAASKESSSFQSLKEREVLTVVHKKASEDVDVLDPAMNEDEDEDEDEEDLEEEDKPPRRKQKAKRARPKRFGPFEEEREHD